MIEKKLLPSILSADFGILAEQVAIVEKAGADILHIDPMDNHYVPNLTMGPDIVKWIKKRSAIPCDVHLMTEKPETLIAPFKEAGPEHISVPYVACKHLDSTTE